MLSNWHILPVSFNTNQRFTVEYSDTLLEGRRGRGRMYLNAHAPPVTHSINTSSHEKCFRLTRGLRVRLPDGAKTLGVSSSSLLWQSQDGSLLAPSFGEHSR